MRKKRAATNRVRKEEEVSVETQVARLLYLAMAHCVSTMVDTLEEAGKIIEKSGSKIAK
jgi:hypothetical protein